MTTEEYQRVRKALKPYLAKPFMLQYKGYGFALNFNPRKGICIECSKKIGDEYINHKGKVAKVNATHLHHLKYDDDHPLENTIELCEPCHNKLTRKQTQVPFDEAMEMWKKTGKLIRIRKIPK